MEKPERLIDFQKIRHPCEGVPELTTVLLQVCSPVRSLMVFAGFQKPENVFQVSVSFRITIRFPLILIAETNLIYHIIQLFDHMEGIDTDLYMREILSCNRDKSVAHVTAEEFHPPAFFRRELAKVWIDSAAGDLIQDIDHRVGIPVGDAAVIFVETPFVCFGAPDAAVSLELIHRYRWFPEIFSEDRRERFKKRIGRCPA